jgi:branched-chain amino acid aminotransferase
VFARLEADRAGADDALFLTDDGDVAEATSANVFAVREGRLVTPPLDAGILPGTTRTWLLDGAGGELARLGLVAAAEAIRPTQLVASDEAFLSSSVAGIVPLVAVDGRSIGRGRPGRVTVALRAARERWIDEQSRMEFAVAKGVDGAQTR